MGVFFALLSPAVFGINNYIDKFLLEKHKISVTVITIYGGFFGLIAGILVLCLTGFYALDIKSLIIILTSGVLTTLYLLPYYQSLTLDETSYIIPLFQFYPLFVLLESFLFLHEKLSIAQYVGSFFIIIGGFLLATKRVEGRTFRIRPAFWYMILSSFLFGTAQTLYKLGVAAVPFWHSLPYEGFGIAIGALLVLFYKKNAMRLRKESQKLQKKVFLFMAINEAIYIISRYSGYFAISLISVGIVSVLAGFQPMFVLIYGIILSVWFPHILKEVITKKALTTKLTAIILMLIGFYYIFL